MVEMEMFDTLSSMTKKKVSKKDSKVNGNDEVWVVCAKNN